MEVKFYRYTVKAPDGFVSKTRWTTKSFALLAGNLIRFYNLIKIEEKIEDIP